MMTEQNKYPISVMRGYKPERVRYFWYIKAKDEEGNQTFHCGLTHGGITNLTKRGKKTIMDLRVADLVKSRVYTITDVDAFIKEWGENYFDTKWRIPKEIRVVE